MVQMVIQIYLVNITTRHPRETCFKRHHGEGSLMVWAVLSAKSISHMCFYLLKSMPNSEDSPLISFVENFHDEN